MKKLLYVLFFCALSLTGYAQGNVVSGRVTDATDGSPMAGVTIRVEQSTVVAATDLDGRYSIRANTGDVLVFSFIGKVSLKREVKSDAPLNVSLEDDKVALDEVVVVGYGVVKKSDVTGSVASVKGEEMMKKNPISVVSGLQGAAAGVLVTRNGGPSGGSTIRIRGIASVNNSTDPLFVVDGVRVGTNIDYLNPADVQNIEVLKDASATAIYGSEGANGVIMVTTYKGEIGRARVNFTTNQTIVTTGRKIEVLDAPGFAKAARRAAEANNATLNAAWWNHADELQTIDWQDEMSRIAIQSNYSLSVTGGSDNTRAVLSVGYSNNQGTIINQNFQRLTARLSIDNTIKQFLRIGGSAAYTYMRFEGGAGSMLQYASIPPTMDDSDASGNVIHVPVRGPDGTWGHFFHAGNDVNTYLDNPVAASTDSKEAGNYSNGGNVVANLYAEVDLFKGLTFRSTGAVTYNNFGTTTYSPLNNRPQANKNDDFDAYSVGSNQGIGLSLENYLTYHLNLNMVHDITLMAGHSVSSNDGSNASINAKYFPVPTVRQIGLTQDPSTIQGSGGLNDTRRMESFFGRLNYSLLGKYLFTATVRRDGSSNFGAGNRYGTFPSASLAWRLSEETFIKNLNVFSNLKLRAGWGLTGNSGFSGSQAVDQLSSSRIAYYFFDGDSYTLMPGLAQVTEIDRNLKWETNEQINLGLDFGFANNVYSFSLDYYIRNTKDLLLSRTLRPSTGYASIYTNAGEIRNSGVELTASFQKPVGDWFFNVRLNASSNKNEVVDVGLPIFASAGRGDWWENSSVTENGRPLATFYGYRVDGIFQTQAEIDALNAAALATGLKNTYQEAGTSPGDFKFKDLDGNGVINDLDREYLGNGFPTFNFGLNFAVNYKNWDASVYLYGLLGQDILAYGYKNLTTMRAGTEGYQNILKEYADNAWTSQNHSTKYQRLTRSDDNQNTRVSDYYLMNGNFLKIRNLQIGYSLPKDLLRKIKIDNLRVYLSMEDLFTFTNYPANLDPELPIGNNSSPFNSVLTTGIDQGHYPLPFTISFGVSISL
ncbi:MAG: TonB-dependent receptor [Prevotellaceae bacterium]|jgi:TonB-linked SusC/RagA family outer membrane protein|nr:TonB-dependent receptor [Prevotellaceae bacterium]